MKQICASARDALHRAGRITSANRMSTDDFKALAKDVEEVGELVSQLETINPHIVPALFEVPFGRWKGWSGLTNYRNRLVHEVADLLEAVTSVGMTSESFGVGLESDIKTLPRTSESSDSLPGSSVIVLRFDNAGELMAARSWRDEKDDWRSSIRYVLRHRTFLVTIVTHRGPKGGQELGHLAGDEKTTPSLPTIPSLSVGTPHEPGSAACPRGHSVRTPPQVAPRGDGGARYRRVGSRRPPRRPSAGRQ